MAITASDPLPITLGADMSMSRAILHVENRYSFRDLSHLSWSYFVSCDASTEEIGVANLDIVREGQFELSLDHCAKRLVELQGQSSRVLDCWLNIRGFLKEDQPWAKKGHELVAQQLPVSIDGLERFVSATAQGTLQEFDLTVEERPDYVTVSVPTNAPGQPWVRVDRSTGTITSLSNPDTTSVLASAGGEVMTPGISPNFTRACTDNDRGGVDLLIGFVLPEPLRFLNPAIFFLYSVLVGARDLSYAWSWNSLGFLPDAPPRSVCRKLDVSEERDRVVITAQCDIVRNKGSKVLLRQTMVYTLFRNGRLHVKNSVAPQRSIKSVRTIPRVGLSLPLCSTLFNMTYCGRGEVENYPDRKACARMGVYDTTARDNEFDYIVPSENGNKTDCRWVAFRDDQGRGIMVASEEGSTKPINVGASLNSQRELHAALHTVDLEERRNGDGPVFATIDYKMMGIAGDVR